MKGFWIGFSVIGACICGIVIAFFHLGVLQFHFNRKGNTLPVEYRRSEKQTLKLYLKKNGSWLSEELHVVLSDDMPQKIQRIVTQWLLFAFDESMIAKPARVQTVFEDAKKNTFIISFDRSFFSKESCLQDNWMLIEGLLKTLRDNGICGGFVAFLINYQPWDDRNLDFSQPWPVIEYTGRNVHY